MTETEGNKGGDDPVNTLLTEEEKELKDKEEELKKLKKEENEAKKRVAEITKPAPQAKSPKIRQEEVAMESPQELFRKVMLDSGFKQGLEATTKVFFSGDADDPSWLDTVLQLANVPAKNRKLIITSWYGKTPEDLGITVEPSIKSKDKAKDTLVNVNEKKSDEIDISKMAADELKDYINQEKTEAAMEMIAAKRAEARARREEIEDRRNQKNNPQQATVMMRQVQRPVIVNGAPVQNKDGTILYETIQEPVPSGSGGGTDLTGIAAIIAAITPRNNQSSGDSEIVKALQVVTSRIDNIQSQSEVQRKDDENKRLQEKLEREKEESKKDREKQEADFKDRLDRMEKERIRDLTELKERFQETIKHKDELDAVIGGVQQSHKKEMDEIKKRLEHAQTSIERTVVSKGTETVDKMTEKVGDIAESVIKPMVGVMKDHYATVIDQQRKTLGLPELKSTVPSVSDEELRKFAEG